MDKNKVILIINIWIITVIIGVAVVVTTNEIIRGGKYWTNIKYKNRCDYVIPDGWEIESNGKEYIIKHSSKGNYGGGIYLCSGANSETVEHYAIVTTPLIFISECKAKDCLYKYLENEKSKASICEWKYKFNSKREVK